MTTGPDQSMKNTFGVIIGGVLAGLLLGGVFAAGFITHDITGDDPGPIVQAQSDPTPVPPELEFPILHEVHGLVAGNFYRELPSAKTLEYAAIRGYLGSLEDPYSFFNDPPVAQSESDALAGIYGGIGVTVNRNERGVIELFPYPDGPAASAGVIDRDVLIAINGEPVPSDERLDVVRQQLRGEVAEGSGVEITVSQPDVEETRTYFIAFAEIRIPSTVWRILPGEPVLGYIHITSFTSRTPEELEDAIAELKDLGAVGLVLDLRDNFGGLLQESIEIADEFLDGGIIVIEQSRQTGEVIEEATTGGLATEMPMIIIVNERTASAAEVVAGALQQNDRAVLVGQRTRGKGSVQFIYGLSDGSSFRITGAVWLTPDRTPLDGFGLTPDIEMIPDENNRDVELGEAIRQLNQQLVPQ
ncbi:MAG: S41 family peptidase [Chloroflexi bacterium]|nr:S41 family peptidase [Chloroflexota bacterium]